MVVKSASKIILLFSHFFDLCLSGEGRFLLIRAAIEALCPYSINFQLKKETNYFKLYYIITFNFSNVISKKDYFPYEPDFCFFSLKANTRIYDLINKAMCINKNN